MEGTADGVCRGREQGELLMDSSCTAHAGADAGPAAAGADPGHPPAAARGTGWARVGPPQPAAGRRPGHRSARLPARRRQQHRQQGRCITATAPGAHCCSQDHII